MRLLVTGSEGRLMQAVIPQLQRHGHDVVGADSLFRYGDLPRSRSYELKVGDLTDPEFARQAIHGVDGVIQAAARVLGVAGNHRYPADILSHDVTLHQNVLWAAQEAGIEKVAYISSSMVLEGAKRHPSTEQDAFDSQAPASAYGLSKLVGERLSMAFAQQYGVAYVIWRPFNIISPHEKPAGEQGAGHVYADFIRLIVDERRNPLPVLGDGGQVRCFTWIDDVASIIARWSFEPATDNEVFNLSGPERTTLIGLATVIHDEAQAMGLIPRSAEPLGFVSRPTFGDDVTTCIPDTAKVTTKLGFTPSKSVRDSIRACLALHADAEL